MKYVYVCSYPVFIVYNEFIKKHHLHKDLRIINTFRTVITDEQRNFTSYYKTHTLLQQYQEPRATQQQANDDDNNLTVEALPRGGPLVLILHVFGFVKS